MREQLKTNFHKILKTNIAGGHQLLYHLLPSQKLIPIDLPSEAPIINRPVFIGKFFTVFFSALLTIFISMSIGMFVRYSYITILTIFALVGGKSIQRKIGWMQRYIEMTESRR